MKVHEGEIRTYNSMIEEANNSTGNPTIPGQHTMPPIERQMRKGITSTLCARVSDREGNTANSRMEPENSMLRVSDHPPGTLRSF